MAQPKIMNPVFAFQNVHKPLSFTTVCHKTIYFVNMKAIYTVEDCMAYKATADCGVLETKQNPQKKLWQSVQRVPVVFI